MSIRFTNPKRKRVSCDVCDASMKVDASVDAMSDVIGGKFIKMTSSEAIPRHACVKCVRENRAEIKGSRSAEGAAEIFAAMNAELAAHDDPNAPDFMTPVESTAQNIIDGFEDFADDYGEGIPVVQAKKNRKHVVALGSKVCLTGKFAHGTRNEVQDELVREGYAKSSTAERADVVVKGDLEAPGWQSSKLRRAGELNRRVMTESEFYAANIKSADPRNKELARQREAERLRNAEQSAERERIQREMQAAAEKRRREEEAAALEELRHELTESVSFEL